MPKAAETQKLSIPRQGEGSPGQPRRRARDRWRPTCLLGTKKHALPTPLQGIACFDAITREPRPHKYDIGGTQQGRSSCPTDLPPSPVIGATMSPTLPSGLEDSDLEPGTPRTQDGDNLTSCQGKGNSENPRHRAPRYCRDFSRPGTLDQAAKPRIKYGTHGLGLFTPSMPLGPMKSEHMHFAMGTDNGMVVESSSGTHGPDAARLGSPGDSAV